MRTVRNIILSWFRKHGRRLPWRMEELTPFQYLVTEKLLQQTTVTHVLKIYDRFMNEYADPHHLASEDKRKLAKLLKPLGFYNFRAEELVRIAREVLSRFGGSVPDNLEDLKKLPGVGEYTAKAVLIAAYKKRAVAVDENLKRLGGRLFLGVEKASPKDIQLLEEKFLELMGEADPREFNWALLDFSWAFCKKVPKCETCPLRRYCRYYSREAESNPEFAL